MKSALQYRIFLVGFCLLSGVLGSSVAQADFPANFQNQFQLEPGLSDLHLALNTEVENSLEFCFDQQWAPTCLQLLMIYRCNQYGFPIPGAARDCMTTAPIAVKILDIFQFNTVIDQPGQEPQVFKTKLIFKSRLDALIKDSKTQTFLADLADALENAVDTQAGFDLFDYTLKSAQGDRFRALEWLGVLFQDTTFTVLPVKYFEKQFKENKISKTEMEAAENLRRALFVLKPNELSKSDYKSWIKLYPSDQLEGVLSEGLNPTIYHYYPMAYWSAFLQKMKVSNRMAFFIPFLFNADYEFQNMDPKRWPMQHPAPFELDPKGKHQARDIYAGLAGALYGTQQVDQTPSIKDFSQRLSANPYLEMKSWFFGAFLYF